MKEYFEKENVFVNSHFELIGPSSLVKNGDITPHRKKVSNIEFLVVDDYINGTFKKINITRDSIMNMAKFIDEAEKVIENREYYNSPF